MSQPLNPVFNSHRKFLEFANGGRPYVVVELDDMLEPTPIAGYSNRIFAINACNALESLCGTCPQPVALQSCPRSQGLCRCLSIGGERASYQRNAFRFFF